MCTSAHVEAREPPGGGVESSVALEKSGPLGRLAVLGRLVVLDRLMVLDRLVVFYVFWGLNARCQASP